MSFIMVLALQPDYCGDGGPGGTHVRGVPPRPECNRQDFYPAPFDPVELMILHGRDSCLPLNPQSSLVPGPRQFFRKYTRE